MGASEAHLFCLLLYFRTYITQDFLSVLLRIDTATVCRSIKRTERLLLSVLKLKKKRKLKREEAERVLLDCTEQPIQRPSKGQKEYFSGKKKQHTVKTEVRATSKGKITDISKPAAGSKHDFAIYKEQLPLPADAIVITDMAYPALIKLHRHVLIPRKKPRGGKLSEEDIAYNRWVNSQRVLIEHIIRQLKIFRILQHRYRNPRDTYAIKTTLIAGLVNFKNGF